MTEQTRRQRGEAATDAGRRRQQRGVAVACAVVAALVVWAVARFVLDVELLAPDFNGQEQEMAIGPVMVILTSGVVSLVGWGALAVLEKAAVRARTIWAALAVVGLIASFGGPLGGTGITDANRIALAAMHVAVAVVLIPLLYRTSPTR